MGSLKITQLNKNIFDSQMELGDITAYSGKNASSSTRIRSKNYISLFNMEKLRIVRDDGNSTALLGLRWYDKDKNFLGYSTANLASLVDLTTILENIIEKGAEYFRFVVVDETDLTKKYGINLDNSIEFVEYKRQEYNLPIQQEMLDSDYFDLDNNKETHRFKKKIFDGTEDWQQSTSDNSVFFINIEDITTDINKFKLISNQYKYIGNIASVNSIPNNKICGFIANSTLQKRIILRNNNFTTLESFKASLVEKNMTLYYVSYTAAELDLTEEQKQVLNELNNLELFKGINNIYTEQDLALLQLNYTVDTKMYIDNKMANQNAESES